MSMEISAKTLKQEQYMVPIKIILMYIVWKIFHWFAIQPGTALNHYWESFIFHLSSIYAVITAFFVSVLGMKAVADGININLIESNRQIWVQDHCLAIPAMVVFTGSVIFFRGAIKDKATFLFLGLIGIVIINIVRLIFVCFAFVYLSEYYFKMHHSVIYVIITYGFIFYLITRWMDRIIIKNQTETKDL